ncbi:MAG: DinB family protein [Chloroflexota bacterium]
MRPATESEHTPGTHWSAKDHLAHLAGIEYRFIEMIRRHIDGDANPLGWKKAEGGYLTRDEIMARVHELTEAWAVKHRSLSMSEVVALGQQARAATLTLLGELTDEQLGEKLPGAPWADGTLGGVLGVNADHAGMHWAWLTEGLAAAAGK